MAQKSAGEKKSSEDELLENVLVGNPVNDDKLLTKRETEVLKLVISGKTNKEMARMLYRSKRTIEYHRNRVMRKLGVNNVADLVRTAVRMGFV